MHGDDGEGRLPLRLPVAVAEHRDSRLNFDQTFFGLSEGKFSWKKKAGDGLNVSATKEAPRPELMFLDAGSRGCPHGLILAQPAMHPGSDARNKTLPSKQCRKPDAVKWL